ncbi:hypothetical protein KAT24_01870 [Candidatus Pacearchaeota archaeon]|nr:hypothetical protein [Candidatus Pacearchaeota archaeon]
MRRETLEKRASNIIEWKGYAPNLKISNLSNFFASAVPELEEKALMNVYNVGFLSYSKKGNFSFVLPLAPNFGFSLDNKKLYFTLREHCRAVLESIGLSLYSKILKHGEYTIPEEINKYDWAVIRAKHLFSQEEIIPKLIERDVINSKEQGNFSVAYKPSLHHRKVYLNLRDNRFGSKYYFMHKKDAINFSKIFHMELEKLEIISH